MRDVYQQFRDEEVIIRDRTGKEYQGILKASEWSHVTLHTDTERILIGREGFNIVSIRCEWKDPKRRQTI